MGGDRRSGLLGEAPGFKVGGHEGVGAVVEHALGELLGVDGVLDPEVPEHGVRFPAAEEHDGIAVDVAPPGRRERADTLSGWMPVMSRMASAACRRALVIWEALMWYHFLCLG